jgi:SAM-dependent MidA family methyltransferase
LNPFGLRSGQAVGRSLLLQTGDRALIDLIREHIRANGPISFAWFMEQVLYHPRFGYYASGRCQIGRRGDYFTNVSVGPLFGGLLAAQFVEIWTLLGKPADFTIVEQGAHHGEFAADVLKSIRDNLPDFFWPLQYRIVEPFAVLQDRQAQRLAEFGHKIKWCDSVDALEPFVGVHFSNELLDAMPVHLVVEKCGSGRSAPAEFEWLEKCVALGGDQFVFVEQPIIDPALTAQLEKVEAASRRLWEETRQDAASTLPGQAAGYIMEVNLATLDWIDALSAKLTRGYLLAFDYGYSREEFYAADRRGGTLQIRAQHHFLNSPFDAIGDSDISAHVEWTSVAERAETNGLRVAGFTDQHHFLTGLISESPELSENVDPKRKRALQTLIHPEMLGRRFQVLALAQNIDSAIALSGFKFARDARAALGLL